MEGKGGSRPVEASSLCSLSAARSDSTRVAVFPVLAAKRRVIFYAAAPRVFTRTV